MAPLHREILIVDDEVGIRELLSEILQDEGYRVATAENAGEARAYRLKQQPALVLLDIWMPDTDGVTLLREWAGSGLLTMPVVMMSGHGTIETAVDATKIGAFDFLEKPIGLSKLLATIARAFKVAATQEPRHVSLTALGAGTAVRETERALDQLVARASRDTDRRRAGRRARHCGARAADARRAVDRAGQRNAADRESTGADRGGARRHAVLRRDRTVFQGRAEGPGLPVAQARAPRL
jgi:DNA-binding NtrC family response regulator